MTRPLGGYLADRFGGARVTLVAFGGMVLGTLGYVPVDADPAATPRPRSADPLVEFRGRTASTPTAFPFFLGIFLLIFVRDRHRQRLDLQDDPRDLRTEAERATRAGHAGAGRGARWRPPSRPSAAVGMIGAVGAHRRLPDPDHVRLPVGHRPAGATKTAFWSFTALLRRLRRSSPGPSTSGRPAGPRPRRATRASGSRPRER